MNDMVDLRITYCFIFCLYGAFGADFTITQINSSSGLYYEKIGEVSLSNSNWEFITYIGYGDYLIFYQYLHQQAMVLRQFCDEFKKKMNNSNECEDKLFQVEANMKLVADNNEIMSSYLGIPVTRRAKRSWAAFAQAMAPYFLEPLGKELAKNLFGKNDIDMEVYNQQIAELQNSQNDIKNEIQSQRTIFKADSEIKTEQIDYLKRTQDKIKEQLKIVKETAIQDSEEKDRKVKDLENLLHITHTQIESQEEVIRSHTNDITVLNSTVKRVNSNLNDLTLQVSSNYKRINELDFLSKLNSVMSDFLFLWTRFLHEQKKLSDVIVNANRGFLDPHVITPIKLMEILIEARGNLPEGTRYPVQPSLENAMKLYKLIQPSIYFYNYTLVFRLNIKLANLKTYHLYKMNSMPISMGNQNVAFILPQKPYFIIDRAEQEYALISEKEFGKCSLTGLYSYICDGITEVNVNSDLECEINLFLKVEITNLCDIRIMHLKKAIFLQLSSPQSWIYAVPTSKDVTIKCGQSRDMKRLENTGFLSTSNNCTVLLDGNILKHIHLDSKPSHTYLPVTKLLDHIDNSKIQPSMEKDHHDSLLQLTLPFDFDVVREKLSLNSISIKTIGKEGTKFEENSEMENYYIAIIAIVSITILVVVLLVCVNKVFHCNFLHRNENEQMPTDKTFI